MALFLPPIPTSSKSLTTLASTLPQKTKHRIAPQRTLHYIGTLFVKGYEKLRKWVETKQA